MPTTHARLHATDINTEDYECPSTLGILMLVVLKHFYQGKDHIMKERLQL